MIVKSFMSPLPWAECPAMNDTSVPEINRLECQVKQQNFLILLAPPPSKNKHIFLPQLNTCHKLYFSNRYFLD